MGKPNCTQCVGCSDTWCGRKKKTKVLLSPAMFGGYVPINDPFIHHASPRMKYTFTKSPLPGMKFSWKIIKDYIYFEHNLTKLNAWYGIGISGAEPRGMGFSDFMISMHNRNYTGI